MNKHVPIIALSLALGACSTISADAGKAKNTVDHAFARLDGFVRDNIAGAVNGANAVIVAKLGPALDNAAHAVFCNKYAQRAYDASEAKNQPACTAGE